MHRVTALVGALVAMLVAIMFVTPAAGGAGPEATPSFMTRLPRGYREWPFVSLAREEGQLDDIRVIVGNETALAAYRAGTLPFPDGTVLARLAYACERSEENDLVFGRRQSFAAGRPKNGLQFMLKDSKKYPTTAGWAFGQFEDGKSIGDAKLKGCFPCHQAVQQRDFVFTRYAP